MTPRLGRPRRIPPRSARWAAAGLALGGALWARAADRSEEREAVFARPYNGYQRTVLADGSFRAETYTFAHGEFWGGAVADGSIDKLTFADVTKSIVGALAGQNYVAAREAKAAQLRIVVSWGTTNAPEYRSMSMENERLEDVQRRQHGPASVFANNAQRSALSGDANTAGFGDAPPVPGFSDTASGNAPSRVGPQGPGGGSQGRNGLSQVDAAHQQDELTSGLQAVATADQSWGGIVGQSAGMLGYQDSTNGELQRFRYFVVLEAYDNHPAPGERAQLRWVTRISISQHHNYFDERLAGMVRNAADYFGQSSGGLVHRGLPEGRVEIGEVRSLDDVTEASTAALSPDGIHAAYLRDERHGRRLVIVDLDHPGHMVFGDVPNLGAVPVEFAWADAAHVEVALSSNAAFTFDAAGRRSDVWTAPARLRPVADHAQAAAAAAAKFPHRTVAVRGWDQAGQRFLLEVSGGEAGARYYVFDQPTDVLIDLGREARAL